MSQLTMHQDELERALSAADLSPKRAFKAEIRGAKLNDVEWMILLYELIKMKAARQQAGQ